MANARILENPLGAEVERLRDLVQRENAGETTTLPIGPFSTYMLIGLCHLGVRQLPPGDPQGEVFRSIAAHLRPLFAVAGAGDNEIIALGGDPTSVFNRVHKRASSTVWTVDDAFAYARDLLRTGAQPL